MNCKAGFCPHDALPPYVLCEYHYPEGLKGSTPQLCEERFCTTLAVEGLNFCSLHAGPGYTEIPLYPPEEPTDEVNPAPYTYGERLRNPYYKAARDIWSLRDGKPVDLMVSKNADVTDILQAFDIPYEHQLGEVIAKILRLKRKPGTDIRQEFLKMHEHIQAAADAYECERLMEEE